MKIPKAKIRGPETGYCNICERYGKLTEDHIPPRGSAKIGTMEIRTFSEHYSREQTLFRLSQKGLLIRSLCSDCNNRLLGKLYDPYLNKISHEVRKLVRAHSQRTLIWPKTLKVPITPQRVVRSIVGHLLAGSLSENAENKPVKADMPDGLRRYFLDSSAAFPKKLEIYYWLYPSNVQQILKGFGIFVLGGKATIIGDFLKFFPLAYWLVWDKPGNVNISLPRLTKNKSLGLDDIEDIRIDFHNVHRNDWPENPDSNMIILYRDEATKVAVPKIIKWKKN